jgi:succinyldiaminopimelate transaminase
MGEEYLAHAPLISARAMLNPRIDALPDYPFDRLRALLSDFAPPASLPPLALSVGEPQHEAPALIAETLAQNAHLWGRYPPVDGTPEFREAVAAWLTRRYRLPAGAVDPARHVLPVAGTREALYMVADLAVPATKNGRRPAVLMPNPFYHVYGGAGVMAGAEVVYLPATRDSGFLPDLARLDDDLLARTALLYLCSPANPQGSVADADYLERVIALARAHDIVLAMDECYAEIYDRTPPTGALEVAAALGSGLENILVFHSLSKRSSAPGLRSGFVAGDPALIAKFRRLRSYAGATVPMPVLAASAALWREESHVEANRALYRAKFDLADQILNGRFGYVRPPGGFFLWLDVGDGEQAARTLWREAALRVLPGAYLGRPDAAGVNPGVSYIRVALVHDRATTADALHRLVKVL